MASCGIVNEESLLFVPVHAPHVYHGFNVKLKSTCSSYLNSPDVVSFENVIRSKIGDLRSDKKAQMSFERMVDQEMGGVMSRLRKSCPNLTESEFQMASYYIAGFDNITVMAIMGISSRENVRTKKRRLKQKLIESGEAGKQFAALLY